MRRMASLAAVSYIYVIDKYMEPGCDGNDGCFKVGFR